MKPTLSLVFISIFMLNGCAHSPIKNQMQLQTSYLKTDRDNLIAADAQSDNTERNKKQGALTQLEPFNAKQNDTTIALDSFANFSDEELVNMSSNALALKDYLHYAFGQLLGVNYIIDDAIQNDTKPITLNIQEAVSKKKLFLLTTDLLAQRDYAIRFEEGIYYIHKEDAKSLQATIAYGYGSSINDVPNTALDIVQMVPMNYGMQTSLAATLTQLTKVKANPDFERNSLLLQGKRRDIIRGLEFINLMDQPAFRNRVIGAYKATYISIDELKTQLPLLLKQEGISVEANGANDKAVSLVTLDRIDTLIVFANSSTLVDRVAFWAQQIDKPATGNEEQYFIYPPIYSRATDLGESIQALLGGNVGGGSSNSTSAVKENNAVNTQARNKNNKGLVQNGAISLVIDERANALIFKASGEEYRKILPLIKRLDVLPKQVMLEVMIAEVTLTDEFKQGVEFAFKNGNYATNTSGSFMGDGFGGLSYLLKGAQGQIAANLFQSNSLVNVLSRPSLVVRDGVSANITVGTDIPIIGETASDPINGDKQTTKIEYRKTGVELEVTPTINAQGIVIMEIKQKISNQLNSGGTTAVSGNPSIFERTISTEVVAESGQTVILGGLISETNEQKNSSVPFFSSIPILGHLFKAETTGGDKTELVVLVTPKVLESTNEWQDIKTKLNSQLKKVTIN